MSLVDISTLAVSHPTPVLAPVTTVIFPDRSVMSLAVNLDFGGQLSLKMEYKLPILRLERPWLQIRHLAENPVASFAVVTTYIVL